MSRLATRLSAIEKRAGESAQAEQERILDAPCIYTAHRCQYLAEGMRPLYGKPREIMSSVLQSRDLIEGKHHLVPAHMDGAKMLQFADEFAKLHEIIVRWSGGEAAAGIEFEDFSCQTAARAAWIDLLNRPKEDWEEAIEDEL